MHITHYQFIPPTESILGSFIRTENTSFSAYPSACPQLFGPEASAGGIAVHGYLGCDLHKRHIIAPPTEQGAPENLCSGGRPTGKAGLPGEGGEVLSHSLSKSNISRSCLRLHNNDPVPPSTKTNHHCGSLPPPRSREWLSQDSVHINWTNEPCISNRDLGCPTSL